MFLEITNMPLSFVLKKSSKFLQKEWNLKFYSKEKSQLRKEEDNETWITQISSYKEAVSLAILEVVKNPLPKYWELCGTYLSEREVGQHKNFQHWFTR